MGMLGFVVVCIVPIYGLDVGEVFVQRNYHHVVIVP